MNQLSDTYNEAHRHKCELDWLEKLPLQKRREYLVLVEQKRNKQARDRLEKGLIERWKNKK